MKYIKFGYHHPSMTKQVKEKAALSLQKVEPSENKDLADQFEIDHLSDHTWKKWLESKKTPSANIFFTKAKQKEFK